jgi:hypothetical protein
MDIIIASVLLVILLFLMYLLFQEIKKQQKVKNKFNRKTQKIQQAQAMYKLNTGLDKKLLTMLGGDEKAALRLLSSVQKNNPGKSYVWYQEKVIRDLEKDRYL